MNLNKLLVTSAAAIFALSAAASFAAGGTLKLEELTKEQRTDMRSRADQLLADSAANGGNVKAVAQQPKAKKPAAKTKTETRS